MALWDKITSKGNVEDRRGFRSSGGGLGLGAIAIIALITYFTGGDLPAIVHNVQTISTNALGQTQKITSEFDGQDSYEEFASAVLGSVNDVWEKQFASQDLKYTEPRLVLFREGIRTGCGFAPSTVGPHYCPTDKTIYLDETFFEELTNRFGANGGDVAQAYVIAHEVGHHAQYLIGTTASISPSNTDSIKLELQADCYAGLWAHSLQNQNVFEPNEIIEAMDAAAAVGDDNIQKITSGTINKESWTHGSSIERKNWFTVGYDTGDLSSCNTFK